MLGTLTKATGVGEGNSSVGVQVGNSSVGMALGRPGNVGLIQGVNVGSDDGLGSAVGTGVAGGMGGMAVVC